MSASSRRVATSAAPGTGTDLGSDHVTFAFIGGGFAGLATAARLTEAGVKDVRIIEKGGDFGGTWYWNRSRFRPRHLRLYRWRLCRARHRRTADGSRRERCPHHREGWRLRRHLVLEPISVPTTSPSPLSVAALPGSPPPHG